MARTSSCGTGPAGRVDALVAVGAHAAHSPAEALAAPLSFSMLANDEATESVLSPETLESAAGSTQVCMASVSPAAADRLSALCEEHGVEYVAAPVLGRPDVAARGDLNIIAAGSPPAVAALEHYFSIIGRRTWDAGTTPRTANVVKVAVNYNIIHALQALAESIALVEAQGGSSTDFVDLLGSTVFGGVVYQGYGAIIAERRYRPAGFALAMGLKDLRLAESTASEVDLNLPALGLLKSVFQAALADPVLDGADWSAIAEVTRNQGDLA
jgi:3-hydroxyisobutyrate dehydrogenase-like beta-hydroxyacid dehydrogenase